MAFVWQSNIQSSRTSHGIPDKPWQTGFPSYTVVLQRKDMRLWDKHGMVIVLGVVVVVSEATSLISYHFNIKVVLKYKSRL